MNEVIKLFLKESIALELNISDLYQLFSVKFRQDYNFWWKLSIEEMNHAALIESINDIFLSETILPSDSIEKQAHELEEMNCFIKEQVERFRSEPLSRADAFILASEIEHSIGESHFELFMTSQPNSTVMKIMQKLNGDDVNHGKKMAKYMTDNNIEFKSPK